MTQKDLANELNISRQSIINYKKFLKIKNKKLTDNDCDKIRKAVLGDKKVVKTTMTQEKKLNKLGIKTSNVDEILAELDFIYNKNAKAIIECDNMLSASAFTENRWGDIIPHPAVKMRSDLNKENMQIVKLIADLEGFKEQPKEQEFDYGSLL